MNNKPLFFESNRTIKDFVEETYLTLRSSGAVPLDRLEPSYIALRPCIHEKVEEDDIDFIVLGYTWPRLPREIVNVTEIVFGQSASILSESGLQTADWKETYAPARRRRYLFDGKSRLAAFLSSKSDIDDVIPTLLAFQMEWNKIHGILKIRSLTEEESRRLEKIFKDSTARVLARMKEHRCSFIIRNCEASYSRYRQETDIWWQNLVRNFPGLEDKTIYFVSSNTHSLINLLSGFAEKNEKRILHFAEASGETELLTRYRSITSRKEKSYILYLLLKKLEVQDPSILQERLCWEKEKGIYCHYNRKTLDVTTQIIDIQKLADSLDGMDTGYKLPSSLETDAVIINIDYPLGRTAYFILSKLSEHVSKLKGIYVIGKAASLFAGRGDVIIPSSIFDQQTRNLYYIQNCFSANDLAGVFTSDYHGVYDRQKAVTVLGTFLQNKTMMDSFQKERILDIEMEAGPYLSAYYEISNANRYPEEENVVLSSEKLELGILHYISDNPRSKEKLDKSLSFEGTDAAYAATTVVLDRIIQGAQK